MSEKRIEAFACRCGEDGKEKMATLRDKANEVLEGWGGDLVNNAIYWFAEKGISIEGIFADQWMGVFAKDRRDGCHYSIQCDLIEDGFAQLVVLVNDKDVTQ